MDRVTMKSDGMSCGHCVRAVTQAPKGVDGVRVEQVKVGVATVAYDPAATSEQRIAQVVADQGHAVTATSR